MRRVFVVCVLAVLLLAMLLYSQHRREPFRVSGTLEADEIRVGSRVGGRVLRVFVSEGDRVPEDGKLFELEPFDLKERRAEAAAHLVSAQAALAEMQAGFRAEEVAQAQAHVGVLAANLRALENGPRAEEIEVAAKEAKEAEERYRLANLKYQRAESLFGKGAITQDEFDRASSELHAARATWEARQARQRLLEKGTRPEAIEAAKAQLEEATQAWTLKKNGYRIEQIAQAQAAVDAADAALRAIDRHMEELSVHGPPGTVVQAIDLQPGDLVGANLPVVSLLDMSRVWVRAYVPENRLNIQVGDPAWVEADSFPDRRFAGRITFIADEAEFTPRNVQTPEERSKQVFRIKVTLEEGLDQLRPGMSADVDFITEEESP